MKRGVFMEPVKLLALDLDGTLLNAQKELTPRTRDALYAAAEAGVEVVPTTGRFFTGMPEVIQKLRFLHYAITINGAQVYDYESGREIWASHMPPIAEQLAREILEAFPEVGLEIYKGRELYLIRGNALTDWQLEREGLTAISCTIDEVPQGERDALVERASAIAGMKRVRLLGV